MPQEIARLSKETYRRRTKLALIIAAAAFIFNIALYCVITSMIVVGPGLYRADKLYPWHRTAVHKHINLSDGEAIEYVNFEHAFWPTAGSINVIATNKRLYVPVSSWDGRRSSTFPRSSIEKVVISPVTQFFPDHMLSFEVEGKTHHIPIHGDRRQAVKFAESLVSREDRL